MRNNLRYEIYADELQKTVDYRPAKKDAIKRAYELVYKYGRMTIIKSTTGEIVYVI